MVWVKHKKSLTNRLLLIIAIAVAFNLLLSFLLLAGTGAFAMLRTEAYEDFANAVRQDAEHLGLYLGKDTVNALVLASNADQRIGRLASRNHVAPQELIDDDETRAVLLEMALTTLKPGLEANDFTGVFILLYDGGADPQRQIWDGVYLRRKTGSGELQDYILERGPQSLAGELGLRVSENWEKQLSLPVDDKRSFFLKAMVEREYDHNSALQEDGLWTPPVDLFGVGDEGFFFTIPLLENEGTLYGVLGVEMSVAEVRDRLMPSGDGKFSINYYMTPSSAIDAIPSWFVSQKPLRLSDGSEIIARRPDSTFVLSGDKTLFGEFGMKDGPKDDRYVAVFEDLNVYSPYSLRGREGYALVGFAERNTVLGRYYRILRNVCISILAATALAALLIYFIAKPRINLIVDAARKADDDQLDRPPPQFKKVDIEEIDHLTSTLAELQKNVRDSALRVSTMFDMLEMPIGCYEYSDSRPEKVFVTPSLNGMLGVDVSDNSMFIDMAGWKGIHERLVAHPCDDLQNTYEWRVGGDVKAVKYFRMEEVKRAEYTIGIITDVTGQTIATKELRRRASYDELTRLHNRHSFRKESLRRIEKAPDKKGVMLFGDLDGLKRINDEYGHSYGDRLIQTAADSLRSLEKIGGVVARLSGDEFAAYVHGFDTVDGARTALYSCLNNAPLKSLELPNGSESPVSMSRGVAVYPDDSNDFSNLLSCADRAMYQAKYSHKGSLVEYGKCSAFDNAALQRMQDEVLLMVKEHRFYYVYQPVFSLESGAMKGYAVYLRPQSRLLSDPRAALETAQMMNLQERIGRMIFEDNLSLLHDGEPAKPYRLLIKTMKYGQMSEREFERVLGLYETEFRRLDVLIPAETTFNAGFVEEKVRWCRKAGAGVAFEHFGANLSDSLELLELGPDMVRIDMGQIRDALRDGSSERKLERIIHECKERRVLLLASGIESEIDYVQAKRWDFDMVQGYYLGYPGREFKPPVPQEIGSS